MSEKRPTTAFKLIIWCVDTRLPKRTAVREKLRGGHLYGCEPEFLVRKSSYSIHGRRSHPAMEIEGFIGDSDAVDEHPARNASENMLALMKRLQGVFPNLRCRIWTMPGYDVAAIQRQQDPRNMDNRPSAAAAATASTPPAVLRADGSGAVLRSDGTGSRLCSRPGSEQETDNPLSASPSTATNTP